MIIKIKNILIFLTFVYYEWRLNDEFSTQITFEFFCRVFDVFDFLKKKSKNRKIIKKNRTRVQNVRIDTIKFKKVRDSRKQHKEFREQLSHKYFFERVRRYWIICRLVLDKSLFLSIIDNKCTKRWRVQII